MSIRQFLFLIVIIFIMVFTLRHGHAAGTVTKSTYVQLTRGGTPLTTLTTPALPNKDCPVVPVTAAECNDCVAKMIDSEKVNRTSGYITYRCLDVSQSYVKFTKPVIVAALGSVTLSWPVPTTNCDGTQLTSLANYRIMYGSSANTLDRSIDVPAGVNKYTVDQLSPGTWYFAIKSLNSEGGDCGQTAVVTKVVP